VQASKTHIPKEVVTAISVLAVNVLLANFLRTLSVITGILSGRIGGSDVVYKTIDEIVIWGFSIALLYLLWRGLNWARWLNLVLAMLNIGFSIYRIAGAISEHQMPRVLFPAMNIILEAIALYLLFLSPGKKWYEHPRDAAAA
jgi:hypothetical protein